MINKRFKQLDANVRAISTLAIVVIVIIAIVGSVMATAIFLSRFWPSAWRSDWPRIIGSGNLVTEEKSFADFTIVEVGNAFDVEITKSSSYSISITADDNVTDYIEVFTTGETLTLRLKWGYNYQSVTLRAKITMPELYELQLSGATHGTVVGFSSSHRFVLDLSGASSLDMASTSSGDVEIDVSEASNLKGNLTASGDAIFVVSGASSIELVGEADDLLITVSGANHSELSDFPVHNATVNLSGASHATVNLDGRLDAVVSGASHLLYIGEPDMGDITASDVSTVSRKH